MLRFCVTVSVFLLVWGVGAQEVTLPVDLRQHNITEYNSSLFNPVFALDRNNPQSVALWTRWQWQSIDGDPTTLFLNYSRKLNRNSVVGAAFFQHNTGVFLNTGGVLNYAYAFRFSPKVRLGIGLNLFGYKQKSTDDRFVIDPQIPFPQIQATNDFILQMAPGLYLDWDGLGVGLTSENLYDYNFTDQGRHSMPEDRIFLVSTSYDFQVGADPTSVLRPTLYWKSIPRQDNQVGLGALYSTDKYWGQAGYNSFYGISVGGGGRFFKKISVGALMEFATKGDLNGVSSTFEVFASYHFGPQFEDQEAAPEPIELPEDEKEIEAKKAEAVAEKEAKKLARAEQQRLEKERRELAKAEKAEALADAQEAKQRRKDSIDQVRKVEALAAAAEKLETNRKRDSITTAKKQETLAAVREKREAKRELDSINRVKDALADAQRVAQERRQDSLDRLERVRAEAGQKKLDAEKLAEAQQRRQDSLDRVKLAEAEIAQKKLEAERLAEAEAAKREAEAKELAQQQEEVKPEANEKYEEVETEDGLKPGFYLITNVFGTQKYYEAFMKDLTKRGLEPQSFLRSLNNYNYVYLKRYDTMAEARRARDSKFDGRYTDKTWIFRVVGE